MRDLVTNQSAADGIARRIADQTGIGVSLLERAKRLTEKRVEWNARRSAQWQPGSVAPVAVEGEPIRKSMRITFVVPAVPIAQPRQRHRVITAHGKTFAQNYTPKRDPVNIFKAAVQLAASQAYSGPPLDGPLKCELLFVLPRPKKKPAWIKKGMYEYGTWKLGMRVPAIGKPDRDNLMKSVQDSLNGWWRDDAILYDGVTSKWLAGTNEQPHVEVTIEALEG